MFCIAIKLLFGDLLYEAEPTKIREKRTFQEKKLSTISLVNLIQKAISKDSSWTIAKEFDIFTLIWLRIVENEKLNPSDLEIDPKVNGEIRQLSRMSRMILKIDETVEHVSSTMTSEFPHFVFYFFLLKASLFTEGGLLSIFKSLSS